MILMDGRTATCPICERPDSQIVGYSVGARDATISTTGYREQIPDPDRQTVTFLCGCQAGGEYAKWWLNTQDGWAA